MFNIKHGRIEQLDIITMKLVFFERALAYSVRAQRLLVFQAVYTHAPFNIDVSNLFLIQHFVIVVF